jgi:hypothetical protein
MRTIKRTSRFKRDYKREAKGPHRAMLDQDPPPRHRPGRLHVHPDRGGLQPGAAARVGGRGLTMPAVRLQTGRTACCPSEIPTARAQEAAKSHNRDRNSADSRTNSASCYIGKADQLRLRLTQYADFGGGKPVGHWGGCLIWQLPTIDRLLLAWKETPGRIPVEVEAELIGQFRRAYCKPPFANDPHRLGV